jgi:glycosyltransferase involved in cell wall biosynthesis
MKILALSPFDPESVTGNAVTLRRIRDGLRARGHDFSILPVTPQTGYDWIRAEVARSAPAVIHLYHSYKTGRLSTLLRAWPTVVTVSGTDLNQDFQDPAHRPAIEIAFEHAARILTYNESLAKQASVELPRSAPKVRVIPKGVVLGSDPYDLRAASGLPSGRLLFFHAGGIRAVKNNLFAIEALSPFREQVSLVFAGPSLEESYSATFARRMAREPWVRHLPFIPPPAMAAAFRGCDVVLNTSLSEGISNALMEAMATGRAILASDIPGNRDLLRDGENALLYRDRTDFDAKVRRLLSEPGLHASLGEGALRAARSKFSADREIDALLEAYTAAVSSRLKG